uniref:Putative secreted protein n=1 Tax=Ixodes ricinus TaxID=34613 RepID=A0A6B0U857_IXORI
MAMPISAFFSAGASFTPSPVMAEISPSACRNSTILLLWAGSTREKSRALWTALRCSSIGRSSNSRPE